MKKLNKKQKEHIKKVFVKTLNIFCYICTGILAIILLVVCLQGCQNKPQKVSAESYTTEINHTYKVKYEAPSLNYVDDGDLLNLLDDYDLNNYVPSGLDTTFTYTLPTGSQLYSNSIGSYYNINTLIVRFSRYQYSGSLYVWRLKNIVVYGDNDDSYSLLYKYNESYSNYQYYFNAYGYILSDETIFADIKALPYFYYDDTHSYFTFNKDYNFNAPLGTNINGLYGYATFTGGSDVIKYINYDIGYFESNGKVFNRIQYSCTTSDGTYALIRSSGSSSETIQQLPSGYWIYQYMYYVNTDTNTMLLVNTHDSQPFTPSGSSGVARYYTNTTTWEIDSYRNIKSLQFLGNNKDTLERFNNNNQTSTGGGVISGDIDNIFTLIASAFTGLLPILNTYILPSITIGTLLFIPLVALLVFAIIRIIKK